MSLADVSLPAAAPPPSSSSMHSVLVGHLESLGVLRSESAIAAAARRHPKNAEAGLDMLMRMEEGAEAEEAPAAAEDQLQQVLAASLQEHQMVELKSQQDEEKATLDRAYAEARANAAAASSAACAAAASSPAAAAAVASPHPSPSPPAASDDDGDNVSVMAGLSRQPSTEDQWGGLARQDSNGGAPILDMGDWGDGDEVGSLPEGRPSLEPQWSQVSNEEGDEDMGAPAKKPSAGASSSSSSSKLVRQVSARKTVVGVQQEERKQFRADLSGIPDRYTHQDDVENWTTTFFFDVDRLSPELLYAMAMRPDDTIQITLDVSLGYRTPDAPLPKVTIEDAGGVHLALQEAIHVWMKIMWRLPSVDDRTGERFNFLAAFAEFMLVRIKTITSYCPLCGARHPGGGMLKLLACQSKMCQYKYVELGIGCDPEFEVRTNPEGVDALISMTYVAATSPRKADVLVPFPESFVSLQAMHRPTSAAASGGASASSAAAASVAAPYSRNGVGSSPLDSILHVPLEASGAAVATRDYDLVVEILKAIPSVDSMREMLLHPELAWAMRESAQQQASAAAAASGATEKPHPTLPREKKVTLRSILQDCHPQAFYLLRWILFTNRSYIRSVPLSEVRAQIAPLTIPDTVKQCFQFVSLPPEKELAFRNKVRQYGVGSGSTSKLVFHGASPEVFHSIVRNGLRVLSNTRLMTAGAALGVGVYFGKTFDVSLGYTASRTGGFTTWPNSRENALAGGSGASRTYGSGYGHGGGSSMLICEIALNAKCTDHSSCYVHQDEDGIMTRYLLRF